MICVPSEDSRSAWASAQSDQSLHCPHEETLGPQLPIEHTTKTLISLGGCPGWSESSLGAQIILLVLSWSSSFSLSNCSRSSASNVTVDVCHEKVTFHNVFTFQTQKKKYSRLYCSKVTFPKLQGPHPEGELWGCRPTTLVNNLNIIHGYSAFQPCQLLRAPPA